MSGVGRNSGWAAGDEEGAPFKEGGREPVRYLDVPESLSKYTLLWFFFPSLLAALGIWYGLNNWLHLPDWTAWLFLVGGAFLYVLLGLRVRQILLFASSLLGRSSGRRLVEPPRGL